MERNVFLSKIRETIAKVSPKLSCMEACYVSESNFGFAVTVASMKDLEKVAEALCLADTYVEYVKGSNFLFVKESPFRTSPFKSIKRIPISMDEGVQIAKKNTTVVVMDSISHAVVISKSSPARPVLSDIAYELSKFGLIVRYSDGNNFIEIFSTVATEVVADASEDALDSVSVSHAV